MNHFLFESWNHEYHILCQILCFYWLKILMSVVEVPRVVKVCVTTLMATIRVTVMRDGRWREMTARHVWVSNKAENTD